MRSTAKGEHLYLQPEHPSLTRLARVMEILAALDDPDAKWLVLAHATWRADRELTLERALEIPNDWRDRERFRLVLFALDELVEKHYPRELSLTGEKLPAMIAQDVRRFEVTAAAKGARPIGKSGLLWDLVHNGTPRSAGGMRKILNRFLRPATRLCGTGAMIDPGDHGNSQEQTALGPVRAGDHTARD